MKNTLKELNGLAEKMVGTNPKAITDAQAISYIKENYEGGGPGPSPTPTPTPQGGYDYVIPAGLIEDGTDSIITNQDIIDVLEEISANYLDGNGKLKPLKIGMYVDNDDQGFEGFVDIIEYRKGSSFNDGKICLFTTAGMDNVYYNIKIQYIDDVWKIQYRY